MQTPGVAQQKVYVEPTDVVGVRLVVDAGSDVSADPHGALLLKHAPEFVAFPDAEPGAPRPFPSGRNDYHPRPVGALLDGANPFVAAPRGALAGLLVILVCSLVIAVVATLLLLLAGLQPPGPGPLAALSIGMIVVVLITFGTNPVRMAGLIQRVERGGRSDDLGVRRLRFTPIRNKDWAEAAWKDYRDRIVVANAGYPRTSYARSTEDQGDVFLQYWQFYAFNDWHNTHEADWEFVTVRLTEQATGIWRPTAAAYSSHLGGQWRTWDDVQKSDEIHPKVFVAQGSHAQYFESKQEGYPATLNQPWDLLALRGRLAIQSNRTDRVVCTTGGDPIPYALKVIPPGAEHAGPADTGSTEWWWLQFQGLWGARDGIPGPAAQGSKWTNPWSWVADMCIGDPGTWWGPHVDPCAAAYT